MNLSEQLEARPKRAWDYWQSREARDELYIEPAARRVLEQVDWSHLRYDSCANSGGEPDDSLRGFGPTSQALMYRDPHGRLVVLNEEYLHIFNNVQIRYRTFLFAAESAALGISHSGERGALLLRSTHDQLRDKRSW